MLWLMASEPSSACTIPPPWFELVLSSMMLSAMVMTPLLLIPPPMPIE